MGATIKHLINNNRTIALKWTAAKATNRAWINFTGQLLALDSIVIE